MSIRLHLNRAFILVFLVLLPGVIGQAQDSNNNSSSKPISRNNSSKQSSRWGDRLQQMKQGRSSSSSSSSSRARSSYQNNSGSNRTQDYSRNSGTSTVNPNRGTSGSSSIDRNRGTTSIDRNRGAIGSNSIDRNRGQSQVDSNRDNRDRNSNDYNRDHDSNEWDRDGSGRNYTHSRNSNHDRDKHSGGNVHNRYRFNLNRNKYSNNYDHDWYDYYSNPYYDRLYSRSYYNRRYYSPSAFSTIILGASIGLGGYYNYDYGKSNVSSSESYVELFEHSGFRGESLEIYPGEGVYDLKDIHIDRYKTFNDRFSSLKVFGEVTVVLYKDADFRGEYVYLAGRHIDFGRDRLLRRFNDEVSSIEVIPGIVEASTHHTSARAYQPNDQLANVTAYEQPPASVASSSSLSARSAPPLDTRSSVNERDRQEQRARVFLFDQADFSGNQIVLTPGSVEVNLSRITKGLSGNWNDSIVSIRVEGGAELFIYTDPEFLGEGIAIRESVSNLAVESGLYPFVNSISSVVVNAVR